MREIRFRVWDKINLKWYGYGSIDFFGNVIEHTCLEGSISQARILDGTNYSIMQYTGLLDCNRNHIYEGDIVKHKFVLDVLAGELTERIGEVYWAEGHAGFAIKWSHGLSLVDGMVIEAPDVEFTISVPGSYEVIGNIYDNHELLTNEDK